MSVTLRHKRFPLYIAYKDPQKSWDEVVKERVVEEIKESGFDKFTVLPEEDNAESPDPNEQKNSQPQEVHDSINKSTGLIDLWTGEAVTLEEYTARVRASVRVMYQKRQ